MFCEKNGLLCSRSRTLQRFKMLVNVCPVSFVIKPGIVTQHHKLECHAEKLVHCVQHQGHSEGLCNQNMTISVVSSKMLVHLQPNCLIAQHLKMECLVKKPGWLHSRSRSQWRFTMSRWYFLNYRTFCYQVWYVDAASWANVMGKFCFFFVFFIAVFKVKVTVRAHMIKIWLLLLYYLNCWFLGKFCVQCLCVLFYVNLCTGLILCFLSNLWFDDLRVE